MIRTLAKLLAFRKAPRTTFFLLSPVRAVKWLTGLWLVRKLWASFGGGGDGERTEPAERGPGESGGTA